MKETEELSVPFRSLGQSSCSVLMVRSLSLQAMGVYGALTKAPVPGAQNSSEGSRDVQATDASLEELGRVKLS